jgi:hypothetical protein
LFGQSSIARATPGAIIGAASAPPAKVSALRREIRFLMLKPPLPRCLLLAARSNTAALPLSTQGSAPLRAE